MTSTMIYWILMLDNIRTVLTAGAVIFTIGGLITILTALCMRDCGDEPRRVLPAGIITFGFAVIFSILLALAPSTKQACVIYLAPKVINNEQVQKVPENILKLLNAKMEQWIDEQTDTEAEAKED